MAYGDENEPSAGWRSVALQEALGLGAAVPATDLDSRPDDGLWALRTAIASCRTKAWIKGKKIQCMKQGLEQPARTQRDRRRRQIQGGRLCEEQQEFFVAPAFVRSWRWAGCSATADRSFAADVVTPSETDKEKVISEAPPGARQYYDGYWFSPPIIADPLANWQPHKPPWQFCQSQSYLGNSWRAALLDEVKKGVAQLAKQGLAKPDVMVTNSNGDINVELTQSRSQIAQGCDVIISFPGSATGCAARSRRRPPRASCSSPSI